MPYRRATKGKKRNYKRRPLRRGKSTSASGYRSKAALAIFPPIKNYPLTYADVIDLFPAAGLGALLTFSGNSLFDPNISGVGSQPRYFDTLCGVTSGSAPYGQYCVLATKVDCFIRNVSSVHLQFSITMCATGITAPSTVQEARERPDTILRTVAPLLSGGSLGKVSMYRKTNSVMGVKDTMDSPNLKALSTVSPADTWVIHIAAWNADGIVAHRMKGDIRITYYSRLSRINDVLDS